MKFFLWLRMLKQVGIVLALHQQPIKYCLTLVFSLKNQEAKHLGEFLQAFLICWQNLRWSLHSEIFD